MATISLTAAALRPLADRVLIRVVEQEERTAGGILLPDTAKEKPLTGEVVALGPGRLQEDGSRIAPEVKVGDTVLYSKYSGTDIRIGNVDHVLVAEKDILAIVS